MQIQTASHTTINFKTGSGIFREMTPAHFKKWNFAKNGDISCLVIQCH